MSLRNTSHNKGDKALFTSESHCWRVGVSSCGWTAEGGTLLTLFYSMTMLGEERYEEHFARIIFIHIKRIYVARKTWFKCQEIIEIVRLQNASRIASINSTFCQLEKRWGQEVQSGTFSSFSLLPHPPPPPACPSNYPTSRFLNYTLIKGNY